MDASKVAQDTVFGCVCCVAHETTPGSTSPRLVKRFRCGGPGGMSIVAPRQVSSPQLDAMTHPPARPPTPLQPLTRETSTQTGAQDQCTADKGTQCDAPPPGLRWSDTNARYVPEDAHSSSHCCRREWFRQGEPVGSGGPPNDVDDDQLSYRTVEEDDSSVAKDDGGTDLLTTCGPLAPEDEEKKSEADERKLARIERRRRRCEGCMFRDEYGCGHPSQRYHMSYGGCLSTEAMCKDPDVSSDDSGDDDSSQGEEIDSSGEDARPQFKCLGCNLVWDGESQCGGGADECGMLVAC